MFAYPGLSIPPDAGGLYQQRCGIPMVVCGPGDIRNAHQPDEYIEAEQLAVCDLLLDRLARALSR